MNERIKLLAEQSMVLDYSTWDSYNQKTVDHYKFNKEKFAELIVRECAKVANELDDPKNIYYIGDQIKEHFGVE